MDEESEPMPDPELLRQYGELVTSEEYSFSSLRQLATYLRRQPPRSEDAVKVGDLVLQMSESVREQLDISADDTSSDDWEDYNCRCSIHMYGVTAWYKLAILLDPSNPEPYIRLAQEVWWELNEWPGTTLKPLLESDDEITLRRVMRQYQEEEAEIGRQILEG